MIDRPHFSWHRTASHASAGIELWAVRQLASNGRPCISWHRTAVHASAGIQLQSVRQLAPNCRPCVSWHRTAVRASAGIELAPWLDPLPSILIWQVTFETRELRAITVRLLGATRTAVMSRKREAAARGIQVPAVSGEQ